MATPRKTQIEKIENVLLRHNAGPGITAAAIARQLGLLRANEAVVEGRELEQASPRQLQRLVASRCVFARMAPHQKLQLVQAAQRAGHFVAVTGDGVNDAPALPVSYTHLTLPTTSRV